MAYDYGQYKTGSLKSVSKRLEIIPRSRAKRKLTNHNCTIRSLDQFDWFIQVLSRISVTYSNTFCACV